MVSFTSRPFYPQGKNPWYLLDRKLSGLQSRSKRGSEENNSQPLPGLDPPTIQPVAQHYTTELSRHLKAQWSQHIRFNACLNVIRTPITVPDIVLELIINNKIVILPVWYGCETWSLT
jgi:hypothetical protein